MSKGINNRKAFMYETLSDNDLDIIHQAIPNMIIPLNKT